jgi:hypothetical protein
MTEERGEKREERGEMNAACGFAAVSHETL